MAVPAGGDTLGDFDKGLDYLPAGERRGETLQLRSLERGRRGWLGRLWLSRHVSLLLFCLTRFPDRSTGTTNDATRRHLVRPSERTPYLHTGP